MIDEITRMAKTLQLKMREYSETMGGYKSKDFITIKKIHFDLLDNLRKTNPNKYKELVFFATIYPTMDIDKQEISLTQFFSGF